MRGRRYVKSITSAIRYPENNSESPHHAIAFPHYYEINHEAFVEDIVYELIENLRQRNLAYKVYHIWNRDDLRAVYENENAVILWLVCHGRRYGIKTGDTLLRYSELEALNVKSKDGIYQLHCNPGADKSLIEINNPRKGKELCLMKGIINLNTPINVRNFIREYFITLDSSSGDNKE